MRMPTCLPRLGISLIPSAGRQPQHNGVYVIAEGSLSSVVVRVECLNVLSEEQYQHQFRSPFLTGAHVRTQEEENNSDGS